MDLQARLSNAVQAARDGQHERALREYVWFHEHALEYDPAYAGVRLSFALAYWRDLAAEYPPAAEALVALRDGKTDLLLNGDGDWHLFHDVEAINGYLEEPRATYDLFLQLRTSQPLFAAECASLAWNALVLCEDYKLARHSMSSPGNMVRGLATELESNLNALPPEMPTPRAPLEAMFIERYVTQVRQILSVLTHTGDPDEAELVRAAAAELVEAPTLREAVRSALVAPAA